MVDAPPFDPNKVFEKHKPIFDELAKLFFEKHKLKPMEAYMLSRMLAEMIALHVTEAMKKLQTTGNSETITNNTIIEVMNKEGKGS